MRNAPFMLLAAFYLCLSQATLAQNTDSQHGTLALEAGLPDSFPAGLRNSIESSYTEPRHALIPVGDRDDDVIYFEGYADGSDNLTRRLWHLRQDSTASLQGLSFVQSKNGSLVGEVDLSTDASELAVMPLRLQLESEELLYYRWIGSGSNVAGGEPVEILVEGPIMMGQPLPEFSTTTIDGQTLSLSDLSGRPLVINTWAIWCAPCIAEMPGLNRLARKYEDHGITFLALGFDSKPDILDFLETRDFVYEQALFNEQISRLFGEAFPRNVIVDSRGIVVYDHVGATEEESEALDQAIQSEIIDR